MGQRIQSSIDSDVLRQRSHVLSIEKRVHRKERRRGNTRLCLFLIVGDDRIRRDFASRPRRRGNMRHRQNVVRDRVREDPFRRILPCKHGNGFCRIHRRTSANGNHTIRAHFTRNPRSLFHAGNRRVVRYAIVDRIFLPVHVECKDSIFQCTVLCRAFSRNDQNIFPESTQKRGILLDAILPAHDAYRHIILKIHENLRKNFFLARF